MKLSLNGLHELDLTLLGSLAASVSAGVGTVTQTVTGTDLPVATATTPGVMHPDGTTCGVDSTGKLSVISNGGGYNQLLQDNGWVALPNGLIVQWITGTQDNSEATLTQSGTWPIPFPGGIFAAYVTTNWFSSDPVDSDIVMYQMLSSSQTDWTVRRVRGGQYVALTLTTPTLLAIGY